MEPRIILPGLLACALSCAAFAAEQTDLEARTDLTTGVTTETQSEAIEHVEAVAYPVPEVTTTENETDRRLLDEQFREKIRQEIRRAPNRQALINSVQKQQKQLLEALRTAGERQISEEVVQETAAELREKPLLDTEQPRHLPLQPLEPAALTTDADVDQEEEAAASEPAQESPVKEDAPQEPT
ncbi:hypothetical protein [uncultured Microbulbifer sp.]|uniref:hypothetical protein n=1 Tax=uncultured Microbulbifer sp. TaxID=348147 RepID=UPI00262BEEC6|nr:hypothetical protein [uncultured Microbulbifer sp.]